MIVRCRDTCSMQCMPIIDDVQGKKVVEAIHPYMSLARL
jgi:hypothetical protein